jgi:hypothetical protein
VVDIAMDAPADSSDEATGLTVTRCFLEPDPLAEALYERTDPPDLLVSVDLMLDELVALLVTRPVAAQAPGCLTPEGQASLWDPTSTAPQCTAGRESPSSEEDSPSPGEEDSPSPGEAARRLARFVRS